MSSFVEGDVPASVPDPSRDSMIILATTGDGSVMGSLVLPPTPDDKL
jgi:hypothetical protein